MRQIKQNIQLSSLEKSFANIISSQNRATQIVNLPDFNHIMEKRKMDNFWEHVISIQALMFKFESTVSIKFTLERDRSDPNFNLALEDICHLNGANYYKSNYFRMEVKRENEMK